jgi:ubiquinone/menaquinone biosynthesis C-methylase UbiE
MPSFKHRSYQKELLDGDDIPFEDIERNMLELDVINHRLGGHDITLDGVVELIKGNVRFNNQWQIAEIGCGGGDNLKAIKTWADHIKLPVQLIGIDSNKDCINYARRRYPDKQINFIHSDYRDTEFDNKPDIIYSSLFCHHFTDDEMVSMLQWMRQNSHTGFFINDLHRHPLAYYSIKLLTLLFSKSYLVKNDAPLSVQRGFIKQDWIKLFNLAGIETFKCEWRWAFRWLITCHNADKRTVI